MAYFIRTRRLDLDKLSKGPQENLDVVHAVLRVSVKELLQRLGGAERQFYGPGKNASSELRQWAGPIRNTMSMSGVSQLGRLSLVEEIIRQASMPEKKFTVDLVDINKLKDCLRKCLDAVPARFNDIIRQAKTILSYCERYCLSFYDPENDHYLETAHTYENQRINYIKSISDNLSNISKMAESFRNNEILVSDMSSYSVELARKTDCESIGFLLMFPEACENVRTACTVILKWIDFDGNFADFISNDMKDLELKKEYTLKNVRSTESNYHQLRFRQKTLQINCENLSEELEKMREREDELFVEEEQFIDETNEMKLQIETKEYRRDELIKNAAKVNPELLYEKYSELSEDLRDLKLRLPYAKRQVFNARLKLDFIAQKKVEVAFEQKKLAKILNTLEEIEQLRITNEMELDNCVKSLEIARKIHLFKSSPDAMEKIFNQRPVEINNTRLPGKRRKDDLFERICDAVACSIDTDWPKMYRALPFYPPRGTNTIDEDIRTFSNLESNCGIEHISRRCIHRWRRFHTRAKIEDLKDALVSIKRMDVLQVVEDIIHPPKPDLGPEEEIPTYVEEYLIPFVREVEKFDRLRAANKI